jgi:hypothetical protein
MFFFFFSFFFLTGLFVSVYHLDRQKSSIATSKSGTNLDPLSQKQKSDRLPLFFHYLIY